MSRAKRALRGAQIDYYFTPSFRVSRDLYLSLIDLHPTFLKVLTVYLKRGRPSQGIKFQLRCNVFLEKFAFEANKMARLDVWFPADTKTVLSANTLQKQLNGALRDIEQRFDAFVERGSGWVVKKVLQFCLTVNRFKLFQGGCKKSSLPGCLSKKRCCLSIERREETGEEDRCFLNCLVAGVAGLKRNPTRWCALYSDIEHILLRCWPERCSFPVTSRHWKSIDKYCPVSVNVYGFEKGVVFPLFLSVSRVSKPFHVDVLLCKGHYFLIRNLAALVSPQVKANRRKCYICPSCLVSYGSRRKYEIHLALCKKDGTMYRVSESVGTFLSFDSFKNMVCAPFVIYSDLETCIEQEEVVKRGKIKSRRRHVPISVAALTVCRDRPEFGSKPFIYTGKDCVDVLLQFLDHEVYRLRDIYDNVYEPCRWGEAERKLHDSSVSCAMCRRSFDSGNLLKVRDHCHVSGRYRFALCSQCNLTRAKRPFEVPVLFHGLSNYDSHFIVRQLALRPMRNIHVIPRNSERYLAFTYGSLYFKDSYQFLADSLASLVQNLKTKGVDRFRYLNTFIRDEKERDLMCVKGVFPYSYVTNPGVLLQTSLPEKERFFNDLNRSHISDERYAFALKVWQVFGCRNLKDYLHVYLLADCLLLADVFENYRDCCLTDYRLDPIHYFSSPHFTFDAFLLHSGAQLELLADVDQFLFLQRAMRGGLSMVSKRYSKANHPSLSTYDASRPHKFLLFLDANNLYGKAMMEPLPVSGFRWMNRHELTVDYISSLSDEGDWGCFVECTLLYPDAWHDLHDDYPLAPVKRKVTYSDLSPTARFMCDRHGLKRTLNKEKLLTTFEKRGGYVLHYRNLKLYLRLGLVVEEIRAGLLFKQKPVMKDYVEFNSLQRARARNDFDVDFYKLLSNSLFGKTIENPEKRTKVKLCRTREELEKSVGSPTFKRSKIIDDQLVGVEMRYSSVKLNKPYYIGVAILELAKRHMYEFHYDVMKTVFGPGLRLLYTDTDSLLYEIEGCADPYPAIFAAGYQSRFDFSNFPSTHPLHDESRKRLPGAFKDECNASFISEFVGLRSKMYSLHFCDGSVDSRLESKVAKGVKASVIRTSLAFDDYVDCLKRDRLMEHSFKTIRSVSHDVHTYEQSKVSLSAFDDKRYLLDNVHSVPYGHYRIKLAETEKC